MAPPAARARCVHLLPDTHDAGAENQARYLLSALREHDWLEPELAYFGAGRAHGKFEELGVPMLHLPRLRRFRFDAYGRARRLRRAFRDSPPAILHTWLLEANVVGLLAARAWSRTCVVITQRGSRNELDYAGLVRLQRLLLGGVAHAVSNSDGGAEVLREQGLPADRISVISNGIPAERVQVDRSRKAIRDELGWSGQEIVAWVGRANDLETARHKDLRTLFAATESLNRRRPGFRLAMVGPTVEEIEARGLQVPESALTLGWRARPAELLEAADAVIISSLHEGNSNVAGEALLLGLPVATTDCGGHCETVRRCGGLVVPRRDPEALAAATARLLDRPPERAAVRAAASERLSVDRMATAHVDLYRRLLGGS